MAELVTASCARPISLRWRWLIWLSLATVSLLGVTRFQVDNTLDAWVPNRVAMSDLSPYLVAGGVLMGVLTRSAIRAIQSIAAIVLALTILLGAIGFSGVRVDMSMLLVPPMMISMGFSYAAHNALRRDAKRVLVLCLITTILGVLFFSASGVPSIRAFAFWGAIGVVLIWLAVVSLVPAPETDQPTLMVQASCNRHYRRLIYCFPDRWQCMIVVIATALALLGPLEANHLAINPQPLNYFPHQSKIVQDNAIIEANLTGMLPFEVITDDAASFQALVRKSPLVRTCIDITAMHATDTHQGQHVFWCMCNNGSLDALPALFANWHQYARRTGITLDTQGIAAQLLEVRQQMKRVAAVSIPSMLLITAIISSVIAGSVHAGLAGLVVNLLPLSLMMLLAELWRLPLQLPTLMVGAIGIGAGVDDTIHILWLSRHRAKPTMLSTCLIPCGGSSAITSICMAFFLLSPFEPTAQFGLLMAVILLLASVSNLFLLPILISKPTHTKASGKPPRTRSQDKHWISPNQHNR